MTTIAPTSAPTQNAGPEPAHDQPARRAGHVGRITALATAFGAVTTLFLAFGVFGGATEPVIIGTVLLVLIDSLDG